MSFFLPFRGLSSKRVIPVWDGNPDHLPVMGEKFLYKDKTFTWKPCDCGNPFCHRPTAYAEDGQQDEAMSYRLRGKNTGDPRIDILLKLGRTPEQLATDTNFIINTLIGDLAKAALASGDPHKYLEGRSVTEDDLTLASLTSLRKIDPGLAEMLAKFLL